MWPGTVREFEDRCAAAAGQLDVMILRDEKGEKVQVTLPRWGNKALVWGALGVAGALAAIAVGALGHRRALR